MTTRNGNIPEVPVVALVGRKEAARLLGIKPENLYRIEGVPRPLQDRRIKGFEVTTGPLWPRSEIEALVKRVKGERAQKRRDEAKAKRARDKVAFEKQQRRARRQQGITAAEEKAERRPRRSAAGR